MEISAHYVPTTTSTSRSFDSTDKILDEIDAKLNGVAKLAQSKQIDVNDDPGVDMSSVQRFRDHMHYYPSETTLPDINLIVSSTLGAEKEPKTGAKVFHEKRTNLLQGYDDDINLLRKMLQGHENTDPKAKLPKKPEIKSVVPDTSDQLDAAVSSGAAYQRNDRPLKKDLNSNPRVSFQLPDPEPNTRTCDYEAELEKITKERDELRARIRRGEASRTSIEERQELERQLHSTRSDLFQQRKKSRQQLEDIEEKLEEAQHYYDEKLAEKDEIINKLQNKLEALAQREKRESGDRTASPLPVPPDNSWLKREISERDSEINRLSELIGKQQQALDDMKLKLENEAKKFQSNVDEKLSSQRTVSDGKLSTLKAKFDKENVEKKNEIVQLKQENRHLRDDNLELTQNLEDYRKQIEIKESKAARDAVQKENDYKTTTELLRHKIESLKEELSRAFASKSELELDFRRKENQLSQESRSKESDLLEGKKKSDEQVKRLQAEVAQTITKFKEFKADVDRQDQSLASSVCDECNKLSNILNSVQSSANIGRKPHFAKGNISCKRAVCELQDLVVSLNRSTNDLLCDFTRLKRESRKKIDFTSYQTSSDVNVASEEAKLLREKLNEKELELKELQVNMTQWKDLTAQRLAEKFQEELQLQVERKLSQHKNEHPRKIKDLKLRPDMGRFSKSANNLTTSNPQHSDSSTVKLLSHLQGRVKQLRTENDLLRSSNYIKGLDGR